MISTGLQINVNGPTVCSKGSQKNQSRSRLNNLSLQNNYNFEFPPVRKAFSFMNTRRSV